jgi:hypothetical protein
MRIGGPTRLVRSIRSDITGALWTRASYGGANQGFSSAAKGYLRRAIAKLSSVRINHSAQVDTEFFGERQKLGCSGIAVRYRFMAKPAFVCHRP